MRTSDAVRTEVPSRTAVVPDRVQLAKMKAWIRRNCRHTIISLRLNIREALQPASISLTLVQKWLRKMRDYMTAHETLGATGV